MALITWDNNLSVEVAEIDEQHRNLITMINQLHDAMRQGKGKAVLQSVLDELISYTGSHFATEERYFDKYGYSEAREHISEHAAFVRKVSDFKEGFESGKFGVSIEVMSFLSDWLKNHIKGSDKRYTMLFNERGLN